MRVDSLETELLGRLAQEGAQLGEPKAARAIMALSKACDDTQERYSGKRPKVAVSALRLKLLQTAFGMLVD